VGRGVVIMLSIIGVGDDGCVIIGVCDCVVCDCVVGDMELLDITTDKLPIITISNISVATISIADILQDYIDNTLLDDYHK
jgi:hypothetical protein